MSHRAFLRLCFVLLFILRPSWGEIATAKSLINESKVVPGASQPTQYCPLLSGKRVGLVMNQTSLVGSRLLLDTLLAMQVWVTTVFVPEHGFRGTADAGASLKNTVDSATGLPIISLYGKKKKPSSEDLSNVDVVVYDLQDVGVRFYTYISTLQLVMEACSETGKELIVLDRPNPNGDLIDGPVLADSHRSFVGMQPIPILYGMTVGEYAQMLIGERWFAGAERLKLKVVPCQHYTHQSQYALPVPPSPNLRTDAAIRLYPSLCLFEGTAVSVGRGTEFPFQQFGHPAFAGIYAHSFIPKSTVGATQPLLAGKTCFGLLLAMNRQEADAQLNAQFQLRWLIDAYQHFPDKASFFSPFFKQLAGTDLLQQQIVNGLSEQEIRNTWAQDLKNFKAIRKKYLLYPE